MFKLTHELPGSCYVAASGGVDSMAALHFLSKSKRVNGVVHINHGTGKFADEAESLVRDVCKNRYNIEFISTRISGVPQGRESKEKFWRDERYNFFKKFSDQIVLAHNMNDCLEEYIMCTMVRGYEGTIPYRHANCVRPFRLWKRSDIASYAERNKLTWIEDPSNANTAFKRNFIRHELVPRALQLNPGVWNIVRKLVELK